MHMYESFWILGITISVVFGLGIYTGKWKLSK